MIDLQEILAKMNPNQKINYDRVMQQMTKAWVKENVRPKILVHVCCAPCSTYTLEYLTKFADLTVYFANSNIHPKEEYHRRAYVTQKFVSDFNEKTGKQVQFLEADYNPNEYVRRVRGLEEEPEGGDRCRVCFDYRLDKTAQKAVELGFDYFASALTISPHKNSQTINSVGIDVQKVYTTRYLPSDFKKNNGYRRSVEMCEEYDIYRQCYCGCVYAAKAQAIDLVQIKKEAKAFMQDRDGAQEFPQIRFVFDGKEVWRINAVTERGKNLELESKVKLGEFYKALRLARKVKQKDVAKGKLSKSQLSKFESGQSMLSADRMISAIEGINLTFAEFGHVLNGYRLTDYEELMKHIMTLLTNEDKGGLEALLEQYLNQEDVIYYRLNSLVIKNAIHSLDRE